MVNKTAGQKKGRYNFLIDSSVYREFSGLCSELGLIRSKVIENHMKSFIKQKEIGIGRGERSGEKGRYNFIIDSGVYDDFSFACEDFGLVRSKNIEMFMRGFIDKNRK